jgi:hypothetical protein
VIEANRGKRYCDDCPRSAANVTRIYASEAVMSQPAVGYGLPAGKEHLRKLWPNTHDPESEKALRPRCQGTSDPSIVKRSRRTLERLPITNIVLSWESRNRTDGFADLSSILGFQSSPRITSYSLARCQSILLVPH